VKSYTDSISLKDRINCLLIAELRKDKDGFCLQILFIICMSCRYLIYVLRDPIVSFDWYTEKNGLIISTRRTCKVYFGEAKQNFYLS